MAKKKYVVRLTADERLSLKGVLAAKRSSRFGRTRASIFLKADEGPEGPGWTDARIADAFDVGLRSVSRARAQLVEEGLDASLKKKSSPRPQARVLDGEQEARLIALACGPPPEGRARWTLQLLADRMAALDPDLDRVSYETVRTRLKKSLFRRIRGLVSAPVGCRVHGIGRFRRS